MSRPKKPRHGIFCLESEWWGARDTTTVEPVFKLLESQAHTRMPYLHRNIATRYELEHHLKKWTQKGISRYPLLYLGCHGSEGVIHLGDGRSSRSHITLDDFAGLLEGRCAGKLIHFGSCRTVDVHGQTLNAFLRRTHALGVIGYRAETDWIESAAFEVLMLGLLQDYSLTRRGLTAWNKRLRERARGLARHLDFRLVLHP